MIEANTEVNPDRSHCHVTQSTAGRGGERLSLPEMCSVNGCEELGTHVLAYRNPAYGRQLPVSVPEIVREPVCEECGAVLVHVKWVQRAGGVLARNGLVVSVAPFRIRVRNQADDEPGANQIDDWEDTDAAAILLGRAVPLVIEIIDGAGNVLVDVPNRIGSRWLVGDYEKPEEIADPWVRYAAADHWTPAFGISPGDLVVHQGVTLSVIAFEQVDQDYGDIGANTGFMICMTGTSTIRTVHITELKKVWEVTA
ncbi:hypothetical protein AB0B15_02960 [Streptomyces sp. NPDC045456]|uniref:hypothetical protein n=1 Tax=Streptomyces sp. NPDC045456 TaxID=3155254 RepID=UPI0033C63E87